MASSSSNVVGVHYRVGKKIGEGSFGVIFEGTNLLNNQQVAIKFVRPFSPPKPPEEAWFTDSNCCVSLEEDKLMHSNRNLGRVMLHSCETSIERTKSSWAAV